MLFNSKTNKTTLLETSSRISEANDNRLGVDVAEYIPHACHYDRETVLTKNGELLQTIKITGFNFETIDEARHHLDVRSTLRKAIQDTIQTNEYAFWFHTLRRKRDLSTEGAYPEGFAKHLNEKWVEHNQLREQYVNELYVTILLQGEGLSLLKKSDIISNLFLGSFNRKKYELLAKKCIQLTETVNQLVSELEKFGARKLRVEKHSDGIYYSEIVGFLSKIINLTNIPAPLGGMDLSEVLPSHQIFFGHNLLEIRGYSGTHYGTMLSVKEYHEVSTQFIDEFLQLPQEFIISETFDFLNAKEALEHFEKQKLYSEVMEITEFIQASGIADLYESDKGNLIDFGEHQITMMLLNDDRSQLEQELSNTVNAFQKLGIQIVHEDLFMEDCYWSQLPGNFEFISRMTPINTRRLGGYASLYNFPAGKINENLWGHAVTVFFTASKTPYFFNFHYENNGHTLIIGPFGSGKTVLKNFLLSESRKFNPKLFYLDYKRGGEILLRSLKGSYFKFNKEEEQNEVKLNPFQLADNNENRGFLYNLLKVMISSTGQSLSQEDDQKIRQAIEYTFKLQQDKRLPSTILPAIWPFDLSQRKEKDNSAFSAAELAKALGEESEAQPSNTAEILADWYSGGEYAHFFDNATDQLTAFNEVIYGFDITKLLEVKEAVVPVAFYLMHRIYQSLDGTPTMIVVDEAWRLLDHAAFAPRLELWLDMVRNRNGMVIFASESIQDVEKSNLTKKITDKTSTQIFLPNKDADNSYETIFGLTPVEVGRLKNLDKEKRQFLLKHYGESVVAELNLEGMDYEMSVLAATEDRIALMEGCISEKGEDPEKWLPLYKERLVI